MPNLPHMHKPGGMNHSIEVESPWWIGFAMFLVIWFVNTILKPVLVGPWLTARLLRQAEPSALKDALVETWTNITLVSALMLTISASMFTTVIPLKDDADKLPHYVRWAAHAYVWLTGFATLQLTIGTVNATVRIITVKPLSMVDMAKFVITAQYGLGAPLIDMILGTVATFLSLGCWVLMLYGEMGAVIAVVLSIWIMLMSSYWMQILTLVDYDGDGEAADKQWKWALPRNIEKSLEENPSLKRTLDNDPHMARLFEKLGGLIEQAEYEPLGSQHNSKNETGKYAIRESTARDLYRVY